MNIKPNRFDICVSMVENLSWYTPLIMYPFSGSGFQSQLSTTPSYKKMLNNNAQHSSTHFSSQTSYQCRHLHASSPTPQPKEYISTIKKIWFLVKSNKRLNQLLKGPPSNHEFDHIDDLVKKKTHNNYLLFLSLFDARYERKSSTSQMRI